MCKLRHKLPNAKKGVGQTFTWSIEAWYIKVSTNTKSNKLEKGHKYNLFLVGGLGVWRMSRNRFYQFPHPPLKIHWKNPAWKLKLLSPKNRYTCGIWKIKGKPIFLEMVLFNLGLNRRFSNNENIFSIWAKHIFKNICAIQCNTFWI